MACRRSALTAETADNLGMHPTALNRRTPSSGFTLIELLITVAIIAILSAIAYPSFMEALRKSRRADAMAALTLIQQAQERWRANNAAYTTDLGASGLKLSPSSPDGHYTLSVTDTSPTNYTANATVKSASVQAQDLKCAVLQVSMSGSLGWSGLIRYSSINSTGTVTNAAGNPCWVK